MKRVISFICSISLAATLAGCSNSSSASGSTAGAGNASGGSDSVTLTMWAHQNEPWNNAWLQKIQEFEDANPGITINLETFPYDEFESKVQTSLIDGEGGADIYELWGGWALDFAPTGALLEIPEDFEEDTWSSEPILTAMGQGIMQTNDDGKFLPNRYVSRAMLVEILYCMEGCPNVSGRAFKDVPEDAWYAKAVLWAACNNIISGDDINTFSPDKALSRQDLYGVLYNYARYRDVLPGNAVELDGFVDVGNVPYYDIYPLQWAVGNGLLGGDSGRLYPTSFTTRAQVAQIMTAFKEKAGL